MAEHNLNQVRFASTVSPYMQTYTEKRCTSVKLISNPVIINASAVEISDSVVSKIDTLLAPRLIMINNGWNTHKNGLSALLAFKLLQQQLPNATLHLFGQGSEPNGLAYQDAIALNLNNINYYGPMPHNELLVELKKAHLLIHPALEESFGVVLIEAMAYGVPVIGGKNSGAVPWVVNDKRLLVDVTKPELIKQKIITLINEPILYQQISIQAYNNVVSRFASKLVTDAYINYYQEILVAW